MKVITKEGRIEKLFRSSRGNLLSVYYTAGFPIIDDTVRIGKLLSDSGADVIEVGIPFSDPVADGPVIQASNKVALDNGMNLKLLLDQVRELRSQTEKPIILMGYFNPVLQFGVRSFCEQAANAGADGLIIPDLPLAEYLDCYQADFKKYGLKNIFLISPTTSDERIRKIDEVSEGFIYAVSASSTTGAKSDFTDLQQNYFQHLQQMKLKNPFLIGFGISSAETFSMACKYAAGAIVGSAFISMLEKSENLENDIPVFINSIKSI